MGTISASFLHKRIECERVAVGVSLANILKGDDEYACFRQCWQKTCG